MHTNLRRASGLYVLELGQSQLISLAEGPCPPWLEPILLASIDVQPPRPPVRIELRLDVDGLHPLHVASITTISVLGRMHWVAKLNPLPDPLPHAAWNGAILFRSGPALPFDFPKVKISVLQDARAGTQQANLTMVSSLLPEAEIVLDYKSPSFHPIEMQLDFTELADPPTTKVEPFKIPNSFPSGLSVPDPLTLKQAYVRAGFAVSEIMAGSPVSLAGVGNEDDEWDEDELNEALQKFWAAYTGKPKWAMWIFFADRFKYINTLGYMFDITDPQRQGTAIFKYRFGEHYKIGKVPSGEVPEDWRARSEFFVMVHEVGHAFNLHHAWDHVKQWSLDFPIPDNQDERTFMNYPWAVKDSLPDDASLYEREEEFYKKFEWDFTKPELVFLRHAPEEFVQMGYEWWTGEDELETDQVSDLAADLDLRIGIGRSEAVYSFLEPIQIDIVLSSQSDKPRFLDPGILCGGDSLKLVIRQEGRRARRYVPYGRYCQIPVGLVRGRPVVQHVFASAGRHGWYLAEPGNYIVKAALNLPGERVVSKPMRLRILAPRSRREDAIALDYFTDEMGRTLFLHGSHSTSLAASMALLRTISEDPELAGNPAAVHAGYAVNRVRGTGFKEMVYPQGSRDPRQIFSGRKIKYRKPEDFEKGTAELQKILLDDRGPEWFGFAGFAQRCFWWATRQQVEHPDPQSTEVIRHLNKVMGPDHLAPILRAVAERWPPRKHLDSRDSR